MNEYEEKQQAKRERYEARAVRAAAESNALCNSASEMASIIPPGQPILVGHHSERRDRNYRSKIGQKMRKSIEAEKKAEYYRDKAAAVGTGGISSDDPDAIAKLSKELAELTEAHEKMKQANKLVRKNDTAGLIALGFSESKAAELLKGDFAGRKGFAQCTLTNSNASIRRVRQRIESLEKLKAKESVELVGKGYTYREDTEENRVMFGFEGKPPEAVRAVLKRHAFKWSPSRDAWVRQLTNAGIYAGRRVRQELDQLDAL